MVYIEEAHASDMWQLPVNVRYNVVYATPRDISERQDLAGACVRKLGLEMPALVDDFSNTAERAYTAWPDRLYLIDRDGRVAWKSAPGPFGFDPEELQRRLKEAF